MTVLAAHIGHRCVPLDDRRLRCHDCQHTLVITQPSSTTSTSKSPIPGKGEPRCATHPTEHASSCRTCAADAKVHPLADLEHGHRDVTHQPTADVAARAAEARSALPPRRLDVMRAIPDVDPARMAQARAELDAAFPRIQHESETEHPHEGSAT